MKTTMIGAALIALCFSACTKEQKSNTETIVNDTTLTEMTQPKSLIAIVEIPASDFIRATKFYQTILNISIERMDMEGIKIGLFPGAAETTAVQIISGGDYKPSADGVVVYLNAGDDLQPVLDKITDNGGKVLMPKTAIGPDMGFYALFNDTEGNKVGLHSMK